MSTRFWVIVMGAVITLPLHSLADDNGKSMNIYKDSGQKQTSTDFKPAPDEIKTNFGVLTFEGGAFP